MAKRQKKVIKGTTETPRLVVFRSNKHIYAQIIDDSCSHTLVSCSTLESSVQKELSNTMNIEAARCVGENLAKKLIEKNITKVVFDRGNKPYHGRIKALAEGTRIGGIKF
ncbi:unnamed protein product [Chrysoparadoxa australica]